MLTGQRMWVLRAGQRARRAPGGGRARPGRAEHLRRRLCGGVRATFMILRSYQTLTNPELKP